MMSLPFLFSTDSYALGKADKDSFSQQALMESLIDEITTKSHFYDHTNRRGPAFPPKGTPKDICEWVGVTMNDKLEVARIDWPNLELKGEVKIQYLPNSVRTVDMMINFLQGALDLTTLPKSLRELNMSDNAFSGPVDLKVLPKTLQYLNISRNTLSGTVDLTRLPESLDTLKLSLNYFYGETDFSQLPPDLVELDLACNDQISGEIHIQNDRTLRLRNTQVRLIE